MSVAGLVEIAAAGAADAALRWSLPFLAVWALTRQGSLSAAAKHHLWALLLGGILLIPIAARVLPEVAVQRPEAPRVLGRVAVAALAGAEVVEELAGGGSAAPAPSSAVAVGREAAARRAPEVPHRLPWKQGLAWLWLWGVTAILMLRVRGSRGIRRSLGGLHLAEPGQVTMLDRCRAELGVRRRVHLLASDEEIVPMTWGWLSPVIVLPATASSWESERLRRVLLHELAHVARLDAPLHGGASLICSLFWFHPGVWVAARELRRQAEMACDDRVVQVERAALGYAEDLVGLARSLRPWPPMSPALQMAQTRGLELRIRRILDRGVRRGLRRRTGALLALLVTALVAAIGTLQWREGRGPFGRSGEWLEGGALGDGRAVWTMECREDAPVICHDGARRAVDLLQRSGRTGAVVAQDVATGEVVLFAAVRPPGVDRRDALPLAPPGSVAKLPLAALWMESGVGEALIPCPSGVRMPSGRTIANVAGQDFGDISAEQMLIVSCNTAAIAMATELSGRMGPDAYLRAVREIGFGGREIAGSRPEPRDDLVRLASTDATVEGSSPEIDAVLLTALGIDGSLTTPLHVSRFLQAIGNGGVALPVEPLADGGPARRVVGPNVATRLQRAMRRVVEQGTAARTLPQLEWSRWSLGGKTGTVPNRGEEPDGWFAGLAFAPDGAARYTIVVLLESGGNGGGAPAGIAAEMTRLFARANGDEL